MHQAKLFKNGNSVVLAIPEEIRQRYELNAGDTVKIIPSPDDPGIGPQFLILYKAIFEIPKETHHARKATRKAH